MSVNRMAVMGSVFDGLQRFLTGVDGLRPVPDGFAPKARDVSQPRILLRAGVAGRGDAREVARKKFATKRRDNAPSVPDDVFGSPFHRGVWGVGLPKKLSSSR